MPIVDYVTYLEEYCTTFDLWKHIELSTRVLKLKRRNSSGHTVTISKSDGTTTDWDCDAVAICTGLHVSPNVPKLHGIEHVPTVMHSSEFKLRKQFGKDTNVVVLGTGETGMDMAHLAVTSPTKTVTLCHRDGFLCAAKIGLFVSGTILHSNMRLQSS